MKASERIIVIGRQYGCGARELANSLSATLGVPFYDKELLRQASERLGMRRDLFERADECRPSPFEGIWKFFYFSQSAGYASSPAGAASVYEMQSNVIRELASDGGCVIIGRTADYLLRDNPRLASLFLHAPMAHRLKRATIYKECPEGTDLENYVRRRDRMRRDYYNYFTGRSWGDAANYHLSIDSSILSLEDTTRMVINWLEGWPEKRDALEFYDTLPKQ